MKFDMKGEECEASRKAAVELVCYVRSQLGPAPLVVGSGGAISLVHASTGETWIVTVAYEGKCDSTTTH